MFSPKFWVLIAAIILFLLTIVIGDYLASLVDNDSIIPALAYLLPVGAFIALVIWYRKSK